MIKSIETTGKTEDDAISSALALLGKVRDEVSVEILERARSGFLGIGASPAKVRVSYEFVESPVDVVKKFLEGLLERMGSDAALDVQLAGNDRINVNLTGEKLGLLIGRRGETLDAIQHITNYVINRTGENKVHVNVDAESYRSKREESLKNLAEKVAGKVLRYRKNLTLEPMNSYERHVIHTALQDFNGVSTFSTGSEPNRRIVIAYGSRRDDNRARRGQGGQQRGDKKSDTQ